MTMTDTWASNATVGKIGRWLNGKRSVVVLTHAKPDGDAVGSTVAVARALNIASGGSAAGFGGVASRAEVWFAGPMPPWLGAVVRDTKHRVIASGDSLPAAEPDAVLITDTGAWTQLDPLGIWVREHHDRVVVMDHHLNGDADVAPMRLIETGCAAACQVVAPLCAAILGVPSAAGLPSEVAEPLYLGLATDTGWFRHSNVTPAVMRLAADLLEAGLDHEWLHETIELRERPSRLRLLQRVMGSLEMLRDDRVGMLTARQRDFAEAGASPGESGGFLDLVRTVESVRVAVMLTEAQAADDPRGPLTKLSFRSKGAGGGMAMVNVNDVASELGGGGHAQAAGAKVRKPLAEVKPLVIAALDRAMGTSPEGDA
ncbi:MAG: DHH family phosphoesterase [Planctomycetota bacterium]